MSRAQRRARNTHRWPRGGFIAWFYSDAGLRRMHMAHKRIRARVHLLIVERASGVAAGGKTVDGGM
jgi:hypothetical protein